jgi:hypothetical protein
MFVRIDEAGQFIARAGPPRTLCVVAAVVFPDCKLPVVEAFVRERKIAWEMDRELKAAEMTDSQLLETAEFFAAADLRIAAILSDSEIFGADARRAHRVAQVEVFERATEVSITVAHDPIKQRAVARLDTRLHSPRHISEPDFFQYAVLMPWILARAFSVGVQGYPSLLPPDEDWIYDIAIDPRKGADPGKAGEALHDMITPILVSDPRTELVVPGLWPSDHPFYRHNGTGGKGRVSVDRLLAGGLRTPDSHEDAGLQLADYVAHVIFSVAQRGEEGATAAWRLLAPLAMRTEDGLPLKVRAIRDADQSPWQEERYQRFLP